MRVGGEVVKAEDQEDDGGGEVTRVTLFRRDGAAIAAGGKR